MKQRCAVTAAQMRALDERAIREYGIPGLVLMENAGRGAAEFAAGLAKGAKGTKVVVVCGTGNNGGDGFAAARHLWNRGFPVKLVLAGKPESLKEDARVNFGIVKRMGIPVSGALTPTLSRRERGKGRGRPPGLILDALFGVGLNRPLEEPALGAVRWINAQKKLGAKVIAIDIPSGLHADTGEVMGEAVTADFTLALGLPKKGFYLKDGPRQTGQIQVLDIGFQPSLCSQFLR